jgi:hypothetical protein
MVTKAFGKFLEMLATPSFCLYVKRVKKPIHGLAVGFITLMTLLMALKLAST